MSGRAIEPVSPGELYNVVAGAASQDPRMVVASATRLKEMLDMYGTFEGLSEISARRDVPLSIRQQSIIQFKNSALGVWRNRRLMSDDQRASIRSRSLSLLNDGDDIISDCNKIIIAKIARLEFPSKWPTLFQDLLTSIDVHTKVFVAAEGSDMRASLILRRSLEVLNAVLKELATVKMPAGVKLYGQLVEDLHLKLQSQYATLSAYLPGVDNVTAFANPSTAEVMRLSHIAYKCLCKMAVWLWIRMCSNDMKQFGPWFNLFFDSSAAQLRQLTELRIALCSAVVSSSDKPPSDRNLTQSIDFLTRHVLQFGKLFRRMQQISTSKFVLLNTSKDLVLYYWSKVVQATNSPPEFIADNQLAVFPVRFVVQAMAIFKDSLSQWSPHKKGLAEESMLSKEFVEEAVKLLVTRFIPLNPKDLDAWLTDPEEWANVEDNENDHWEYELRPCAERVLMTFANQYESYVVPLLKTTYDQTVGLPMEDLENIVQKEALYCAIGRCAQRLKTVIPFQIWVSQYLAREAKSLNPNFPIIKRRIAWLLGKWVAEDCAAPSAELWEILMHLLSDQGPGTDLVVRFTAASALKECVDAILFNEDVFLPHMPSAIAQLIELTAEADAIETKRKLTDTLNVIVDRMGQKVVPYMEMVVKPIPERWMSAGEDWLYKSALLETVQKLIQSSKENSGVLNVVTVPLIQESFSPSAIIRLDEDGLKLWEAALQNAMTLDSVNGGPTLLSLFPILVKLLSENLDLLGSITGVMRSYFVLDAPKILQTYGVPLLNAFVKAMSQAISSNQKDLIVSLQLLVQLSPAQLWAEPMHVSGLFSVIIKALMEDKERTTLLTEYICLLARMAISDSLILSQLIAATAAATSRPESEVWNGVMDQWWRRFDNMSEPRYRKLVAMGVACLITTGRPEALERLSGEILSMWSDVFAEMKEALVEISEMEDEESQRSSLSPLVTFWKNDGSELPSSLDDLKGTPEHNRWIAIYSTDPVEREKLTSFVAAKLQQAAQACGGIQALEVAYLRDADKDVLKQVLKELGL